MKVDISTKKEFLTIADVMRYLPMSERTIRKLVYNGKLTGFYPNGEGKKPLFILKKSLNDYINTNIM